MNGPISEGALHKRRGMGRFVPDYLIYLLVLGAALGLYLLMPETFYFLVPLYIGVTFYLFCNVFRVGNAPEALWYTVFIAVSLLTFTSPYLYLFLILVVCVPLQVGIIIWRQRTRKAYPRSS